MINQGLIHQLSKVIHRPEVEQKINEMDWESVYKMLESELLKGLDSNAIGAFTRMLLDCNIDPLNTLTTVPSKYLRYDSKITTLDIPSQVRYISSRAFEGCENLSEVNFSEGVTELGSLVFGGTKISSLYLPDSLKRTGLMSLGSMENLTKVSLGPNVRNIDSNTFSGDISLTEIEFRGTRAQWSQALLPTFDRFRYSHVNVVHCIDGDVKI